MGPLLPVIVHQRNQVHLQQEDQQACMPAWALRHPSILASKQAAGMMVTPGLPVCVWPLQAEPSIGSQLWRTFRTIAGVFIMVTCLGTLLDDKGLMGKVGVIGHTMRVCRGISLVGCVPVNNSSVALLLSSVDPWDPCCSPL
jgi:hypothetical protein